MNNPELCSPLTYYVLSVVLCILLMALANRKCVLSDVKFPAALAFLPFVNNVIVFIIAVIVLYVYVFKPIQKFVGE